MSGIESEKPTLVVESDSDSDFETPIFRARESEKKSGNESEKPALVESDSDSDSDFETPIFRARGLRRSGTPTLPTPPATVLRAMPPAVSVENTPGYANYIQFEMLAINSLINVYLEMIPLFPDLRGYKFSDAEKTIWEQFVSIIVNNPIHMKSFSDLVQAVFDAKEDVDDLYKDTDAGAHVPQVKRVMEDLYQKVLHVREHAAKRVTLARTEFEELKRSEK